MSIALITDSPARMATLLKRESKPSCMGLSVRFGWYLLRRSQGKTWAGQRFHPVV